MGLERFLPKGKVNILVLVAAVAVAFGASLGNGFVWDDHVYLVGRDVYRNFRLSRMFLSLANGVEYLPLRDLTYGLDYMLWGENPAGFHLTNLLLHMGVVIAAYGMTVRLVPLLRPEADESTSERVALLTALMFALHPLQSQAVNFIICRNVLLSGLFFFLSCRFYLSFLGNGARGLGWYSAACACFVAALLSKATTIVLPLLLLLPTLLPHRTPLKRRLLCLAPFFGISIAFFVFFRTIATRTSVIADTSTFSGAAGLGAKLAVAAQIPFFYLKKFLVPTGFAAEYDASFSRSLSDPVVVAAFAAVGVIVAAAYLGRRRPQFPFAAAWFFLALLPVLNFFNTVPVVADRYAYLPIWGLCFAVAAVGSTFPLALRPAVTVMTVLLAFLWGGVSVARTAVWKSDLTLWEDAVRVSPRLVKASINLGEAYFRQKQYDRALTAVEPTLSDLAANDYYHLYEGMAAAEKGELTAAVNSFTKALERNDQFMGALYQLALAHEKLGNLLLAIDYHNRVLLSPEAEKGNYREMSRNALKRLIALMEPELSAMRGKVAADPGDVRARAELALKLDRLGLYDEALAHYREMEKRGVTSWQLPFNMGTILKKQRKYPEALESYERSVALRPAPETWNNIGWLQIELHQYDRAITSLQSALRLDPGFGFALFNLGRACYHNGDRNGSIQAFTAVSRQFPGLAPKAAEYLKEMN